MSLRLPTVRIFGLVCAFDYIQPLFFNPKLRKLPCLLHKHSVAKQVASGKCSAPHRGPFLHQLSMDQGAHRPSNTSMSEMPCLMLYAASQVQ